MRVNRILPLVVLVFVIGFGVRFVPVSVVREKVVDFDRCLALAEVKEPVTLRNRPSPWSISLTELKTGQLATVCSHDNYWAGIILRADTCKLTEDFEETGSLPTGCKTGWVPMSVLSLLAG